MPSGPLDPGLRDEVITTSLEGTCHRPGSASASLDIEFAEAVGRMARHLLRVGRRLRTPDEPEALQRLRFRSTPRSSPSVSTTWRMY